MVALAVGIHLFHTNTMCSILNGKMPQATTSAPCAMIVQLQCIEVVTKLQVFVYLIALASLSCSHSKLFPLFGS